MDIRHAAATEERADLVPAGEQASTFSHVGFSRVQGRDS
jgi:hypothetical protein